MFSVLIVARHSYSCNKTSSVVLCYGTSQLFYIMNKVFTSQLHYLYDNVIYIHKSGNEKIMCPRNKRFVTRTNTIKFNHKGNVRSNRYFDLFKSCMCRIDLKLVLKCQYERKLIKSHIG